MPLYDYLCNEHGVFEERVPISVAQDPISCPVCGGNAHRLFSAPAIHFKGSGFHNTDYKRKREHGAKEEKPPQEVKKDADQSSASNKPA